jgi:class 3 adenylate cyclase/tetratricopeptide (TPR) repeat protein
MASARSAAPLDAYVPRIAAEWDIDAPGALWQEREATCCFVDISGFTALSERLAQRGRIGAEELTEVLNHVFSRMLEVAYGKGGALLKFGGDALLLAFLGDDHATMAAQSAVAMRAALREARTLPTSVGRVNLRMSVGIHSGMFHFFRVGDSHRELIITGPAATATTRMEQAADAGEIVVSQATADRLARGAVGAAKGDGRMLRWRQVVEGGPGPNRARPVPAEAVESSVPVALRSRLAHGAGESEHRLASVGFVKFLGTDDLIAAEGPEATAIALDAIVSSVQNAADEQSVTFLASDIDANGGKIILTAGVPVMQEDDEGRILRAARALLDQPQPLPVRIGINRGHVFAGEIGTSFRRTFTVMGDTVNLAARLMAAAKPGEIYATGTVLDQARTMFSTEAIEPFYVKGKSEPVQAYGVGPPTGTKSESFGTLPFRGREKELTILANAMEDAAGGRGGSIVLEAERGAGKTRLVSEFATSTAPDRLLWLQGEPHHAGVPYQPLRSALRSVLAIRARDPAEAGRELLAAIEDVDPALLPVAPLLATVVDAQVPSTPESRAIAEEFIRRRIADVVVSTLDAACATPLLIVADDAHWFDDTTSEICRHIATTATSRHWLVCAMRRPGVIGGFTPSDAETISLPLLTDDLAQELVEAVTDTAPLRPHEREDVVARAGGNPLFLEELLRIVRDSTESLPDTLDAVAMREIDALPVTPRRILRLASVLGRSFEHSLLMELLQAEAVEAGDEALAELNAQLVLDADHIRLRFRHALLQEAAYHSLPFRQRLSLHRTAAEAIERRAAETDDAAARLSYHFLMAQEWERTWLYARSAAGMAEAAHAPGEVAVHLERAVTASRRLGAEVDNDVSGVLMDLGQARQLVGEYERADEAYGQAARVTKHDPILRARLAYLRARLRHEYLGRPSAAIRLLRAGRAELAAADGQGAGLDALLLAEEANVRERQGRLAQSLGCARLAVSAAELANDKRALALSLEVLNSCLMRTGRAEEATFMDRVVALYEELGDDVQVAIALNTVSGQAFFAGDWDRAADYVERAAAASAIAGDLSSAALARVNLGEMRTNQGRLDDALALLVPAQRTLESYGYRAAAAAAGLQLGRALAFNGDVEGGLTLLRAASSVLDEINAHVEACEAGARVAEVLVYADRLVEARGLIAESRKLEIEVGETHVGPLLDRVELTLAACTGDDAWVTSRSDDILARARAMGSDYDTLVALSILDLLGDESVRPEVTRLSKVLGVISVPMLPPALVRKASPADA